MKSPRVDAYIDNAKVWKKELEALRELMLETPLIENFICREPC